MPHYEKQLASETVFTGRVVRLTKDTVALENGATSQREVVHHNGGACVAAITPAGNVLVVRQYRYALGREMIELPAGKLEPGEDPFAAASRELAEETGYKAGAYIDLGKIIPTCGYCSEVLHLYAAKDLTPVGQHLDEDEFVTVEEMPLAQLTEKCLTGEIQDGKTVAAVLRLCYAIERGLF